MVASDGRSVDSYANQSGRHYDQRLPVYVIEAGWKREAQSHE